MQFFVLVYLFCTADGPAVAPKGVARVNQAASSFGGSVLYGVGVLQNPEHYENFMNIWFIPLPIGSPCRVLYIESHIGIPLYVGPG